VLIVTYLEVGGEVVASADAAYYRNEVDVCKGSKAAVGEARFVTYQGV
jgi:hypothetical protein